MELQAATYFPHSILEELLGKEKKNRKKRDLDIANSSERIKVDE